MPWPQRTIESGAGQRWLRLWVKVLPGSKHTQDQDLDGLIMGITKAHDHGTFRWCDAKVSGEGQRPGFRADRLFAGEPGDQPREKDDIKGNLITLDASRVASRMKFCGDAPCPERDHRPRRRAERGRPAAVNIRSRGQSATEDDAQVGRAGVPWRHP